jgi:cell wall-associated NlpC family hydrolase
MSRHILFAATILLFLSFGASSSFAQKKKQGNSVSAKKDVKFLEDITVDVPVQNSDPKSVFPQTLFASEKKNAPVVSNDISIENANGLQLKYALLLDVEVEQALNLNLFKVLDEWLGTRYRLGGSTKEGIDCSALMQIFFTSLYGLSIPRTAREQFDFSRKISRTELKEGDLVFFNTIGGVSHVGMYLQNNKFIHASTGGVTISDLYEEYWMKRFIGVGRVEQQKQVTASAIKP